MSGAPRDQGIEGSRWGGSARSSGTGDAPVMAASAHITAKTVTACVSSALSLYVIVCDMALARPAPRGVAPRANQTMQLIQRLVGDVTARSFRSRREAA